MVPFRSCELQCLGKDNLAVPSDDVMRLVTVEIGFCLVDIGLVFQLLLKDFVVSLYESNLLVRERIFLGEVRFV